MKSLGSLDTHLSGTVNHPWVLKKSVLRPKIENTFPVLQVYVKTTSPFLVFICQTTTVVISRYNVLNYRVNQNWIILVLLNGFYIDCQNGQTIHVLFRRNLLFSEFLWMLHLRLLIDPKNTHFKQKYMWDQLSSFAAISLVYIAKGLFQVKMRFFQYIQRFLLGK